MNRTAKFVAAAGAALLLTGVSQAGISLDAGRVGGTDVAALAKFYESAFGLKEVRRLQFPGVLEIMLNFGDSVEAAKANSNAMIVIMHRANNDVKDPVPHLIFNVTDIDATVAAITAAGGKVLSKPRKFPGTGDVIGMALDPDGNRLELIQPAQH